MVGIRHTRQKAKLTAPGVCVWLSDPQEPSGFNGPEAEHLYVRTRCWGFVEWVVGNERRLQEVWAKESCFSGEVGA